MAVTGGPQPLSPLGDETPTHAQAERCRRNAAGRTGPGLRTAAQAWGRGGHAELGPWRPTVEAGGGTQGQRRPCLSPQEGETRPGGVTEPAAAAGWLLARRRAPGRGWGKRKDRRLLRGDDACLGGCLPRILESAQTEGRRGKHALSAAA